MIEIKGTYNVAKVYTDTADEATKKQIELFMNQESLKGSKVRIMPDCHYGKGCVIGTTMTITDKIIPNVVGVDINCAMRVVELDERTIDLERLDKSIRKFVPSGSSPRRREHRWAHKVDLRELRCYKHIGKPAKHYLNIGTVGSGNHFCELDQDAQGMYYFVIHTGSRFLGKKVAEYYQQAAFDALGGRDACPIPFELAYCEGQLFDDYLHDMQIVAEYAYWNRAAVADTVQCGMRWNVVEEWETVHNYIDIENMILRKGAISAQKGEKVIIPMNMRDGSLICIGKGNPDWNYSAPHGAGRLMSRQEAKETLSMADFKEAMKDVYSTSVTSSTIDEAPMAYKPMQEIIDNIQDTVEIVNIIKPVYNYKDH